MKAAPSGLSDRLRRYVRLLRKYDGLAHFLASLTRAGEPFLFGGAARDVAFSGRNAVNDLDIFVSGILREEMLCELGYSYKRTNFGGYRLVIDGFDVDVWELQRSHAFRWAPNSSVSVMNLLKTVCFTTDAIAVSLVDGRVIKSADFDWSFQEDTLGFVSPPLGFDALVATRIARVSLKLGLDLSPVVASYFHHCLEKIGIDPIVKAENRWGQKGFLSEIAIKEVEAKILSSVDRAGRALAQGDRVDFR